MRQARFDFAKESTEYGGEKKRGRKFMRPLCTKKGVHLVLKARRNLFQVSQPLLEILIPMAHKFGIKTYDLAVGFDHVHLLIKIPSREAFRAFIRAATGLIAKKLGTKLWSQLPFTRLFHWGRDYWNLKRYLEQNREETLGHRPYKKRKRRFQVSGSSFRVGRCRHFSKVPPEVA